MTHSSSRCIYGKILCLYYIRSGNEIDLFPFSFGPFSSCSLTHSKKAKIKRKKTFRVAIARREGESRKRKTFSSSATARKSLIRKRRRKFPSNSLLEMMWERAKKMFLFRLLTFFFLDTLPCSMALPPSHTHTHHIHIFNEEQQTTNVKFHGIFSLCSKL